MAITNFNDLTNLPSIANGDKVLGERVNGTTVRITFNGTDITTLGILTVGTWNASTINVAYGGTGRSSQTAYAPIVGGTTSTGAHQSSTTGTSGQLYQSGGPSAVPGWTTSTFASTYSASTILYSNGANTVTGLATANNGILVTSAGGVPSISTDIPTAVTVGGAYNYRAGGTVVAVTDGGSGRGTAPAYGLLAGGTTSTGVQQSVTTGTTNQILISQGASTLPTWSTATFPISSTTGDILYASGTNAWSTLAKDTGTTRYLSNRGTSNVPSWTQIELTTGVTLTLPVTNGGTNASSAGITAFNNITGYSATGATGTTSTNLVFSTSPTLITPVIGAASATSVTFTSTTGVVGTTTNDAAAAGSVGQLISSVVAAGSVSLSTGTSADVTSISLTAGDWDVWGNVVFSGAGGTLVVYNIGWISSTSATLPASNLYANKFFSAAGTAVYATVVDSFCVPQLRFSLSGTSNVYLSVLASFSVSTAAAGGAIYARRRR